MAIYEMVSRFNTFLLDSDLQRQERGLSQQERSGSLPQQRGEPAHRYYFSYFYYYYYYW